MKIGVVIDRLNVGGVEKIAIEEVKALRKLGEDARLVVLREKAVVENAFPDLLHGVPIVYLDRRLPRVLRFSFQFPIFHFFSSFHLTYPVLLPFVLQRNEYDYFIVHGTYTILSAASIKKWRGIGFSAFIWDPSSYILKRVYAGKFLVPLSRILDQLAISLDKYIINNMDVVLVGGTAHNAFIHQINPHKNISIIYPSVHPSRRLKKKEPYVLVVTAWKRGKNPEYLLDLVKKIPGMRIKMVGKWIDPLYKEEFESVVREHKLTEQIEVVGEVTESQLANIYSHAQVLLQTNDDRGFGMPALEAAAHGTTFIIPNGQGVCSLFTEGEDGFYTKEQDTEVIISRLKLVMDNPKLATKMGVSAWNKTTNTYSWKEHATRLMQVIALAYSAKHNR